MDMFTIVPFLIGLCFIIVIGTLIVGAVKGLAEWSDNNSQPVLSDEARVVAKRLDVSGTGGSDSSGGGASTSYYATFELPTGERREFWIAGKEYGLLCEGDEGVLRRQGTRYLGFERRLE